MENLTRLRALGWSVAVHNDYKSNGLPMTFWLLTHPSGHWIKGEAATDREAVDQCLRDAIDKCPCCTSAKKPEECICPEWCPNHLSEDIPCPCYTSAEEPEEGCICPERCPNS